MEILKHPTILSYKILLLLNIKIRPYVRHCKLCVSIHFIHQYGGGELTHPQDTANLYALLPEWNTIEFCVGMS